MISNVFISKGREDREMDALKRGQNRTGYARIK